MIIPYCQQKSICVFLPCHLKHILRARACSHTLLRDIEGQGFNLAILRDGDWAQGMDHSRTISDLDLDKLAIAGRLWNNMIKKNYISFGHMTNDLTEFDTSTASYRRSRRGNWRCGWSYRRRGWYNRRRSRHDGLKGMVGMQQ